MAKKFFWFLLFLLPFLVFAQSDQILFLPTIQIGTLFKRLADVLFTLLIFLSVIFVIFGGITFVTAGGDPNRIETAKKMVIYSIVGIIIGATAFGLTNLIYSYLTRG